MASSDPKKAPYHKFWKMKTKFVLPPFVQGSIRRDRHSDGGRAALARLGGPTRPSRSLRVSCSQVQASPNVIYWLRITSLDKAMPCKSTPPLRKSCSGTAGRNAQRDAKMVALRDAGATYAQIALPVWPQFDTHRTDYRRVQAPGQFKRRKRETLVCVAASKATQGPRGPSGVRAPSAGGTSLSPALHAPRKAGVYWGVVRSPRGAPPVKLRRLVSCALTN